MNHFCARIDLADVHDVTVIKLPNPKSLSDSENDLLSEPMEYVLQISLISIGKRY